MITVTPSALSVLKKHLAQRANNCGVRIDVVSLGSTWQSLVLRVDARKANDLIYPCDEVVFLVAPALLSACGPIKVDYSPSDLRLIKHVQGGFTISSQSPLPSNLEEKVC